MNKSQHRNLLKSPTNLCSTSTNHSFQSSLNSIDENRCIDYFNDYSFANKQCPEVYSNYLSNKRQSEPAIRFSFYNKIFDIDETSSLLSVSPTKDYRKYSLPLTMSSPSLEYPISSHLHLSPDEPTWKSFRNSRKSQQQQHHDRFRMTVTNETGDKEFSGSSFESPIGDNNDIDDKFRLYSAENILTRNEFENNFTDGIENFLSDKKRHFISHFGADTADKKDENIKKICKKCGHDIHKKYKSNDQIQFKHNSLA